MQQMLADKPQFGLRIHLLEESLSCLNDSFPGGLQVEEYRIGDWDVYALPYEIVPGNPYGMIARAVASAGLAQLVSHCLSSYQFIPIPIEWAVEVREDF